jgi:hypothetical protein
VEGSRLASSMRNIYLYAEKVLVWLGGASHDSDHTFDYITDPFRMQGFNGTLDPRAVNGYESLCKREYWTRMWIVQETLSTNFAEVCCGTRTMPFNVFFKFLCFV